MSAPLKDILAVAPDGAAEADTPEVLPTPNDTVWTKAEAELRAIRERHLPLGGPKKARPTPQSVIEAVLTSVRARGLAALREPANVERLSRCDSAAKAEINARIAKIEARDRSRGNSFMHDYVGEALAGSGYTGKARPACGTGTLSVPPKQLMVQRASEIEMRAVEWLWPNRIAIGKQTLIAGEPGLGKSQLTIALAAAVTTGGYWPCDEGRAPLGCVIILSAEDDAADTIKPRLIAAGANLERVLIVSSVQQCDGQGRRVFNLQADLDLLDAEIAKAGDVRLVIIDPVSSYLGKTDSHKNSDVRGTLEPLGEMAARLRAAVVSVTHFSKGGGASAINRFIGSIAFVAAARAAFIVMRDPDGDGDRRLFLTAKNNLAKDSGGLAFRIEQHLVPLKDGKDTIGSAIAWEGERIDRTADEVLAAAERSTDQPAKTEAEDFLRDILADGPCLTIEIKKEAKGAGISWRTVERAKKEMGIRAERKAEAGDGLGKAGHWYWRLPEIGSEPPKTAKNSYDRHVPEMAVLSKVGGLSDDKPADGLDPEGPKVVDLEAHRHAKAPNLPALGQPSDGLNDPDPGGRERYPTGQSVTPPQVKNDEECDGVTLCAGVEEEGEWTL